MTRTGKGSYGSAAEPELIEIACQLKAETTLSWLIHDGVRDVWIPKSRCKLDEQAGIALVPEWLAKKEKLI